MSLWHLWSNLQFAEIREVGLLGSCLFLSAGSSWLLLGFSKSNSVVDAVGVCLVELLIEKVCCLCESCVCDRADL